MKKTALLLTAALLAACGQSEPKNDAAAAVGKAPKPLFKVKFIAQTAVNGLKLGAGKTGKTNDGKPQIVRPIEGLAEGNAVELIGSHTNDLEGIRSKCMESDAAGKPVGWTKNGVCETLFKQFAANIADNAPELTAYLIGHAALQPYQADKSGYAAVQNGRYILEADSEGVFYFRRRHY
ncbi:hypothetical protein [Neisseria chenwenguii]|uniref:hypothetical protein n=1 Tax=Neisseria chenwenguii TaxID=1853278 RepID=UPI0018DF5F52|nr:hypothetical protein [Neisseria chenwenguii]